MIILCVGGVSATWKYAEMSPTPKDQFMNIDLATFEYLPEQILPGGNENNGEVILGNDHFQLVNLITDKAGKGYSLNSDNSIIHTLLENSTVIYSNQKISGGNLKFILDEKNNTFGLYYTIEKIEDNLYYVYTFSRDDLATMSGTDFEICVYRTTVKNNDEDEWVATLSHIGYAKTIKLTDVGESASSQSLTYSIDINSWHL